MTEAEIVESITSYYELVVSMMGLYLTVTSGYLIVSYMVGSKLTRSQTAMVTALYIIFALITTFGVTGFFLRAADYIGPLQQAHPDRGYFGVPVVIAVITIILIGGVFMSCKFMWDVRHPKSK
jgi:hypothetical protein